MDTRIDRIKDVEHDCLEVDLRKNLYFTPALVEYYSGV